MLVLTGLTEQQLTNSQKIAFNLIKKAIKDEPKMTKLLDRRIGSLAQGLPQFSIKVIKDEPKDKV